MFLCFTILNSLNEGRAVEISTFSFVRRPLAISNDVNRDCAPIITSFSTNDLLNLRKMSRPNVYLHGLLYQFFVKGIVIYFFLVNQNVNIPFSGCYYFLLVLSSK